ncbi:nitrite reductase small subunit NirD [Nesterenkonia flava]|uniref:Nitrite reductase small subunit NirD n=1 Tax=Nesterenkonia flava TaxID=469799 RepID=A0ABU1FU03_9MICC|nr:nitrite reductase small subunit NirD [Nesterenkonia flava]MDR5712129.1 nitrite reductase small subunit NirD [Nesterenkonia flava]
MTQQETATLERVRQESRWRQICPLGELEPMWGEAALVGSTQIALVRLPDDRLFAVDHFDPYAKANVMARGIVGSRQGRPTLASPIHKQVYDLETGECLSEEGLRLRTYPVRVVRDHIEIKV